MPHYLRVRLSNWQTIISVPLTTNVFRLDPPVGEAESPGAESPEAESPEDSSAKTSAAGKKKISQWKLDKVHPDFGVKEYSEKTGVRRTDESMRKESIRNKKWKLQGKIICEVKPEAIPNRLFSSL